MAKTQDEIHQEELQAISKEILESNANSGQPLQAYDVEAILATRKRREARLAKLAEQTKKSKK